MEYSPIEKDVLSAMRRADFKNISKNEIISFASKLGEMKPEVAKDILAQFPEFVELIESVLNDYRKTLTSIVKSDDESIKEYYSVIENELENAHESRTQFNNLAKKVLDDCSIVINNPNLSPEMYAEILNKETEILKMANKKDKEIREQELDIENKVNQKDTEKRNFNWKLISGLSLAVIAVIGISAGVLGGKFDIKSLPGKS